jgi:hypothetical protein
MGVAVLKAPDLSSAADVRDFYGAHGELVKVVAWLVGAGFFFFLTFLGTLMATLRGVEPGGPLRWVALASALAFTTSLNVAVGSSRRLGFCPRRPRRVHSRAFTRRHSWWPPPPRRRARRSSSPWRPCR